MIDRQIDSEMGGERILPRTLYDMVRSCIKVGWWYRIPVPPRLGNNSVSM